MVWLTVCKSTTHIPTAILSQIQGLAVYLQSNRTFYA